MPSRAHDSVEFCVGNLLFKKVVPLGLGAVLEEARANAFVTTQGVPLLTGGDMG